MFSKLGVALVLMASMVGGCAVWTRTSAHEVAYDYSDHDFYDRTFGTSPSYATTSVYNGSVRDGAVDEQTAPTRAKAAPYEAAEGHSVDSKPVVVAVGVSGSVDSATPVTPATPSIVTAPATRPQPPVQRPPVVIVSQSTSPGPTRAGQSSSSSSVDR